jgi:hypothetical protein
MTTSIDEMLEELVDLFTFDESHDVAGSSGPMPLNVGEAHILAYLYLELASPVSDRSASSIVTRAKPWIGGYAQFRLYQLLKAKLVSREALVGWSLARGLAPGALEFPPHDGDGANGSLAPRHTPLEASDATLTDHEGDDSPV